jgi:hypothetical protein
MRKLEGSAEQLSALAHGYQSNSLPGGLCIETFAVIFHFDLQSLCQTQASLASECRVRLLRASCTTR